MPEIRRGQGKRGTGPDRPDLRSRHVRRRISAEGRGARRRHRQFRLCRRACGRRRRSATSRAGRSRSRRRRPSSELSAGASYPVNYPRNYPNRAAPAELWRAVNGPISLAAPGVAAAGRRDRSAGRGRAASSAIARAPIWRAPAYPPRDRYPQRAAHLIRRHPDIARQPPLPRLGPAQGNPVSAVGPVAVKPAATLACPIVSVLDRWLADSVQPAAHALVRRARGRDQADLGLFLPRHERQSERAYFRARLRQRARHRRLHARRRPPHHREGRLARHAGRAGLSARRAGRGLPAVQHRAGAGLEPSITTITSTST